jgi:hypothetical protein
MKPLSAAQDGGKRLVKYNLDEAFYSKAAKNL